MEPRARAPARAGTRGRRAVHGLCPFPAPACWVPGASCLARCPHVVRCCLREPRLIGVQLSLGPLAAPVGPAAGTGAVDVAFLHPRTRTDSDKRWESDTCAAAAAPPSSLASPHRVATGHASKPSGEDKSRMRGSRATATVSACCDPHANERGALCARGSMARLVTPHRDNRAPWLALPGCLSQISSILGCRSPLPTPARHPLRHLIAPAAGKFQG